MFLVAESAATQSPVSCAPPTNLSKISEPSLPKRVERGDDDNCFLSSAVLMSDEVGEDTQVLELRRVTGCARWSLLYCPTCHPRQVASIFQPHDTYWWAVTLSCKKCSTSWTVCTECSSVRQHYTEWGQLYRHATRNKHKANEHRDQNQSEMGNCTALQATDRTPATFITSSLVMESTDAGHCFTSDTDCSTHRPKGLYTNGKFHFRK